MKLKGLHGINNDVYLSLPCVVGENGVTDIIQQKLTDKERQQLQTSAGQLFEVQSGIKM